MSLAPRAEGGSDVPDGQGAEGDVAEWPEWATVEDSGSGADHDEHGTSHSDESGHEAGLPQGDDTEGHDDHGDEGSHESPSGVTPDRPRAQVLGSFAAVNGGVLLTAAIWRRRTKGELSRGKSARAAALRGSTRRGHSSKQTPSPTDQ